MRHQASGSLPIETSRKCVTHCSTALRAAQNSMP